MPEGLRRAEEEDPGFTMIADMVHPVGHLVMARVRGLGRVEQVAAR
jgi:hypothetical protein